MKRFLGIVAVLSVFLASLLCSSLFFFPWGEVGEYGIGLVSQSLARQGLPLAYDRIEADGRKTLAHARLISGERLVAEADVLFIDAPSAKA